MTIDGPRIGLGTDLHRLVAGRRCVLGGVDLDCPVGPDGHSDGDAILHALTDALLGAGGLPDLGSRFPDDDSQWQGAPSSRFVEHAIAQLADLGLRPISADVAVHCDRPKIAPHREAIRQSLASLLSLPVDRVNVKGKSLEGTGSVEHVSVTAVVLVAGIDEGRKKESKAGSRE